MYNLKIDETESEPLNAQYPDKVEFLSQKLSVWLTEAGARYPVADPQYNPVKEAEYKLKQQTVTLQHLEDQRKQQLSKTFIPNKDWWGSSVED